MRGVLFLLRRYLIPKEGNLLAFALWISVVGVGLGIAVLMLVLAVMSGFQSFLEDKYTKITSQIIVLPRQPAKQRIDLKKALEKEPRVASVTPFLMSQGMVFNKGVGGVVLEGIDLKTTENVTPWNEIWLEKPRADLQTETRPWIWLGEGLAKKIKVKVGDEVSVMLGEGKEGVVPFVVAAITKFGIYDHDMRYAYIDIEVLRKFVQEKADQDMFKVKLVKGASVEETAQGFKKQFGMRAGIKKWNDLNQNIFLAVAHQKRMLFIVLEIVVALAGVNVINLLLMSAYHRRRDTAILRAMGMRFEDLILFYVGQGVAVAALGITLGIGLGFLLCGLLQRIQPAILSEAIYNTSRPPIRVDAMDVCLISVVAFILCLLFSVIPGIRAARLPPVTVLRID